jgi:hypothetical protein
MLTLLLLMDWGRCDLKLFLISKKLTSFKCLEVLKKGFLILLHSFDMPPYFRNPIIRTSADEFLS